MKDPTYMVLGDHTEVIEIRYNSEMVSFAQLVEWFFEFHSPRPAMPRQYRSVILAADQDQLDEAARLVDLQQRQSGQAAAVAVEMLDIFYPAEDYHQKYYLQSRRSVVDRLDDFYGSRQAWFDKPVAALVNSVAGREISVAEAMQLAEERRLAREEQELLEALLEEF